MNRNGKEQTVTMRAAMKATAMLAAAVVPVAWRAMSWTTEHQSRMRVRHVAQVAGFDWDDDCRDIPYISSFCSQKYHDGKAMYSGCDVACRRRYSS